jgi:hypothetical protein
MSLSDLEVSSYEAISYCPSCSVVARSFLFKAVRSESSDVSLHMTKFHKYLTRTLILKVGLLC